MPYTMTDLVAFLLRFCAENLPGLIPDDVDIHFKNRDKPFNVPLAQLQALPLLPPPSPPPVMAEQDEEPMQGRFYELMGDILEVLTAAKRPLTNLAVKAALAKAGKEWSDRWVDEMLSRMIKDGAIENPEKAKPRGYRLPENDNA